MLLVVLIVAAIGRCMTNAKACVAAPRNRMALRIAFMIDFTYFYIGTFEVTQFSSRGVWNGKCV